MKLREVTPNDHLFVSILLQTAFDGPDQARLVERLRLDGDMAMELLAVDEQTGKAIGHMSFAKLHAPAGWWSLAPVAVVRDLQFSGIGTEIIRYGLDIARQAKAPAILATGAAKYFARFGFSAKAAEHLTSPRIRVPLLLYPIAQGTAGRAGAVIYPPAFDSFDAGETQPQAVPPDGALPRPC